MSAAIGAIGLICSFAAVEEEPYILRMRESREKLRRRKKELQERSEREKADCKRMLGEQNKKAMKLKKDSMTIGGDHIDFEEPPHPAAVVGKPKEIGLASRYEFDERDFGRIEHKTWSLRKEDFREDRPLEVQLGLAGLDDELRFVLPYSITNSTGAPRIIGPNLWLATAERKLEPEIGGFVVQQDVQATLYRKVETTFDLIGYVEKKADGTKEMVGAFEAGETKWGVAIFPRLDPMANRFAVVVEGLGNAYDYDQKLERVLAVYYSRPGDEFARQEDPILFQGKKWVHRWMWYSEIECDEVRQFRIEGPTGERTHAYWSYDYSVCNSTRVPLMLNMRSFNTVVTVEIMDHKFDVEFVDDGSSTIGKAEVLRRKGKRFAANRLYRGRIDPGDTRRGTVIFDDQDIDFDKLFGDIEDRLTPSFARHYGEDGELASLTIEKSKLVREKRKLSPKEKAALREEIFEKVAEALEQEREKERIRARVTASYRLAAVNPETAQLLFDANVVRIPDDFVFATKRRKRGQVGKREMSIGVAQMTLGEGRKVLSASWSKPQDFWWVEFPETFYMVRYFTELGEVDRTLLFTPPED